jgi:putative ABC transport system permease protein
LWVFAAMALMLSAVGIYGVTAYSVTRRTRELAIRLAIGASTRSVFRLVTRDGLSVAAMGIAFGLAGALALARSLSGLLFGVAATDPTTVIVSTGVILLVTLMACWRPARRAARVDPMVALREQ